MEEQCLYYGALAKDSLDFYKSKPDIELDSALNELGMLSTVTGSRIDYLKEQVKKKYSSNSVPVCVVRMNSDFVTEFSLSKSSNQSSEGELSSDSSDVSFKPLYCKKMRISKRELRKVDLSYKPYVITRKKLSLLTELETLANSQSSVVENRASPPIVSRQDSGNKSNPSSPVKSQNTLTSVGCSIFRSRSLDNLDIIKLDTKSNCCETHGEIDNVSQLISNLHFS